MSFDIQNLWQHVKVLLTGAILAPGKRTVTAILQIMGCSAAPDFQPYHRVLNRAVWSPLKAAGEDAIRLSMRDTILALEGDLLQAFVDRLRRLVKGVLEDPAFLQRLILEVAGRVAPTVERAELLLPVEFVTLEDLQHQPEEATPGTLMHFVLSLGGGMLRDGMPFGISEDGEAGIRVQLVDEDVQIDLTESAISELLLRHMLPRFRALLRGAVVVEPGQAQPTSAA